MQRALKRSSPCMGGKAFRDEAGDFGLKGLDHSSGIGLGGGAFFAVQSVTCMRPACAPLEIRPLIGELSHPRPDATESPSVAWWSRCRRPHWPPGRWLRNGPTALIPEPIYRLVRRRPSGSSRRSVVATPCMVHNLLLSVNAGAGYGVSGYSGRTVWFERFTLIQAISYFQPEGER